MTNENSHRHTQKKQYPWSCWRYCRQFPLSSIQPCMSYKKSNFKTYSHSVIWVCLKYEYHFAVWYLQSPFLMPIKYHIEQTNWDRGIWFLFLYITKIKGNITSTILCSVLNWRKLWGLYLSTRKSNPVRVRVNVRRAAGRTVYMRTRCALCTLAITNAPGRIHCCAGEYANMQCKGARQFSTEQSIGKP